MILGNGDIASAIKDRKDMTFFACGVSNSQEERESEYSKEISLLLEQDSNSHIVYFSSLSVLYSQSRYARHKRYMEKIVKGFRTYTIIRIGNITWGNNPHTFINHFREQKRRKEKLIIKNVYRFIIDKEEFRYWLGLIPNWSCEMNIPGNRMKVKDIIATFV